MESEIRKIEQELYELVVRLEELRKSAPAKDVPDYEFETLNGPASLAELFGDKDGLFAIHNMGQGCRHCTLWADGINAFLPHLEDEFSVVLFSKDDPQTQRRFANERGWRFRLASHGGGDYIREQTVVEGEDNYPGIVFYERDGDTIRRKNSAVFGPRDQFCSIWHLLSLAGRSETDWVPQFQYWSRPENLDDGGRDIVD
jgi:predicted dithiol-disulfide oxidoreductase (DUF899 family)